MNHLEDKSGQADGVYEDIAVKVKSNKSAKKLMKGKKGMLKLAKKNYQQEEDFYYVSDEEM